MWSCRLKSYNFTKSNTPSYVFLPFFKLYKSYQIAQNIANILVNKKVSFKMLFHNDFTFQLLNRLLIACQNRKDINETKRKYISLKNIKNFKHLGSYRLKPIEYFIIFHCPISRISKSRSKHYSVAFARDTLRKDFANVTRKQLQKSPFSVQMQHEACNFYKNWLHWRCFPVYSFKTFENYST